MARPPPDGDPMLVFREARREDLESLVDLLADDPLGRLREVPSRPLPPAYLTAFDALTRDPNHLLLLAEEEVQVVGMLQVSFLPGLSHRGSWRAQIESVRVSALARGRGIGRALVAAAIAAARRRDCRLVQLTSDKRRPEALRFYRSMGFVESHEGLKLALATAPGVAGGSTR